MSRIKKLYERIKNNPANVNYDDLMTLLDRCGYKLRPTSGWSHRWFFKKDCEPIHFPENRPIREVYVRRIIKVLEKNCDIDEL